jgi:hypothetical protein
MKRWKAGTALVVISLLAASQATAQIRIRMNGEGYCLSHPEITGTPGNYTARWTNSCDVGIWVDYTRLNDQGVVVSGDAYIAANSTGSTFIHGATRIEWNERR